MRGYAVLDVGCGHRPRGTVNVDRYIEVTSHRGALIHDYELKARIIPNLVCADINALPFRDRVFDKVFSDNVIEHISTPFRAIKEMLRVSSDLIEIKCPHRFDRALLHQFRWERKHHISHFTRKWFNDVADVLGLSILELGVVERRNFPHVLIPILSLPYQISFKAKRRIKK